MVRVIAAACAALSFSCVAYNDPCGGLVDEQEQDTVVGKVTGPIFLDRNNARHANHPIARVAAEAFVDAHKDTGYPAQLGIMNGGAIRAEGGVLGQNGQCETRNVLAASASAEAPGEVSNSELHQILLFENSVHAIDLEREELRAVFEHSVSGLTPQSEPSVPAPIISPSGRFLHLAGGVLRVDCSLPPGQRVTDLELSDGTKLVAGGAVVVGGRVRVAMTEFLLEGNDGYSMIDEARSDLGRNALLTQVEGGIDNDIAAAYMKERYVDTPLPVFPTDAKNCTVPALNDPACQTPANATPDQVCCSARATVKLSNCAYPTPPEE